jgi:hypothetical protein
LKSSYSHLPHFRRTSINKKGFTMKVVAVLALYASAATAFAPTPFGVRCT